MHLKIPFFLFIVMSSVFAMGQVNNLGPANRPAILWQKCFGGIYDDKANDVIITPDGGILIAGNSRSNDGDVTNHNGSTDSTDGWVIKLDADTNIQWQHSFGGSGDDDFTSVVAGNDGSYYCIGNTNSAGGDALPSPYWRKIWVVKLSASGNLVWSKTYNSSFENRIVNGLAVSDGNIVISAERFVIKINPAGDVLWDLSMDYSYPYITNIVENNLHQLISSSGFMIDNNSGDTTNLHWQLPPLSYVSCMTNTGNKIFMAYGQQQYNEFCYDGSGFSPGINMASNVGYFSNNDPAGILSQQWYVSDCPDGGRYGGPDVGAAIMHGLATIPGNSFIAAGGFNTTYWEAKSLACLYTGGLFSLYGAPRTDINWTEFRSVKVYPSGNDYICVGHTNFNGGDVSGKHGFNYYSDVWVVKLSTVNRIQGNVFLDLNNNNTRDEGEPDFNEAKVNCTSAHLNAQVKPFDGQYSINADTGSYKTSVSLPGSLYYTVYPDSAISTFTIPGSTDTIDFAIHKIADARDYSVSLTSLSPARPGFDVVYKINYANQGTDTLQNKTVQFLKDSRFVLGQTIPSYSTVSGDTVTWSINNLLPGNSGEIIINMVPASVNISDQLISFVSIDISNDVNTVDNIDSVKQFVTGSYDPNDKQEEHNGFVSLLEVQNAIYLNYTIRFQNTGNDTAFTVIVRDDLDDKLDLSTFEMTGASHTYQLKIKDGKYLEWKFNNILLADSVHNEPASHGYITYRIKPKTNLVVGEIISNTASIYFDFNAPIETNIQKTIVVKTTAVWTGAENDAWENPANWNISVVPDAETVVIIPADVPNYPVVKSNVSCFALRVDKNATISVNEGYNLDITGK